MAVAKAKPLNEELRRVIGILYRANRIEVWGWTVIVQDIDYVDEKTTGVNYVEIDMFTKTILYERKIYENTESLDRPSEYGRLVSAETIYKARLDNNELRKLLNIIRRKINKMLRI